MGLHCLPNLAVNQVIAVEMGVDVALLIHANTGPRIPNFEQKSHLWCAQQHVIQGNGLCCLVPQFHFLHPRFPGLTRDSSPFLAVRMLSCSLMGCLLALFPAATSPASA